MLKSIVREMIDFVSPEKKRDPDTVAAVVRWVVELLNLPELKLMKMASEYSLEVQRENDEMFSLIKNAVDKNYEIWFNNEESPVTEEYSKLFSILDNYVREHGG